MGSSTVYDRNTQKNAKNGNTELKKTGIAPVDQVDPMDSMDVLCYQKNKSVHLVYKNAVLCRKHAEKPSGFLKQAYGFRDREYNKIKNLSAAGNFKLKGDMSFCQTVDEAKYSTVSEKINIRLDIWRNDVILRKTNIKWELLK